MSMPFGLSNTECPPCLMQVAVGVVALVPPWSCFFLCLRDDDRAVLFYFFDSMSISVISSPTRASGDGVVMLKL